MQKVIKQTGILTMSNIIARVLGMLFFILLARHLSLSDYGLFRYLFSLCVMFSIAFSGFPVSITKLISENMHERKNVESFFSTAFLLALLVLLLELIIITICLPNKLLLAVFLIGMLIDYFYFGIIRGFLAYKKLYFYRVIAKAFQLILILAFIWTIGINLISSVVVYSIAYVISLSILELYDQSSVAFRKKLINSESIKRVLKYATPVAIGTLSYDVMFNVDIIMIKHLLNETSVAYYSVSRTLVRVFMFLPQALQTLILPKVSKLKKKVDLTPHLKLMLLGVFSISGILFFVLWIFGREIIILLFNEQYLPALSVLYILALGQIMISTFTIFSAAWTGIGKPLVGMSVIAPTAVFNVILDFLLIPRFGIVGASYATLAANGLAFFAISLPFFITTVRLKSK